MVGVWARRGHLKIYCKYCLLPLVEAPDVMKYYNNNHLVKEDFIFLRRSSEQKFKCFTVLFIQRFNMNLVLPFIIFV